jgi:exodeoxyribonuclease VII large subunit
MLLPFPDPAIQTVGEITRSIQRNLERAFGAVWVEGEISNLTQANSGHFYLKLKDAEAVLSAALYRNEAAKVRFELQDGLKVVVKGRLTVYVRRGEYQLAIDEIQPKGIGSLELAFRQLKEKLLARGFFDPKRKRPLPKMPRRICLITSPTGSAVRDLLEVLGRRWPMVEIWVRGVRVQGDGASQELAAAIHWVNAVAGPISPSPVDLLILARGGGSLEDLWAFNEEILANAIVQSRIPIVTGVGHEDDLTIADLTADHRSLTPSAAAEEAVPHQMEIRGKICDWEERCRAALRKSLVAARTRLKDLADRTVFRRPFDRVQTLEKRVNDLSMRSRAALRQALAAVRRRLTELACRPVLTQPLERLIQSKSRLREFAERMNRATRVGYDRKKERLNGFASQLENLSPLKVLKRGYTLTRMEVDGSVLRTIQQLAPGDRIVTQFVDGRTISRIDTVMGGLPEPAQDRAGNTSTQGSDMP